MKVKICGITHPQDGEYAAKCGADYIGVIFSAKSKRRVTPSLAKDIAQVACQAGAMPVGVFIDETAEEIQAICAETGIEIIQLHGAVSKQAFSQLSSKYTVIYSISAAQSQNAPTSAILLYDNVEGGSGVPFDWSRFTPPQREWYLAGGLNPCNVEKAIIILKPAGVDVSSGVEFPRITRKDPVKVKAFIQAAKKRKIYL